MEQFLVGNKPSIGNVGVRLADCRG
ncbi:MAG: hypothetical protein QOJ59_193, partial [Thermomicrobiales bacterium]|nr:hypothetical protein [Thermomicrobiales bacterium]